VNEALQFQFVSCVFAAEQRLYEREEVPWTAVDYHDNSNALILLHGLGALGAPASRLGNGNDGEGEGEGRAGPCLLGLLGDATAALLAEGDGGDGAFADACFAAAAVAQLGRAPAPPSASLLRGLPTSSTSSSSSSAAAASSSSSVARKSAAAAVGSSFCALVVTHYAGPVAYDVRRFVEKNRRISVGLHKAPAVAASSPCFLPVAPGADGPGVVGGSSSSRAAAADGLGSVSDCVRGELGALLATLATAKASHFVRCLSPAPPSATSSSFPGEGAAMGTAAAGGGAVFDRRRVCAQLGSAGVLALVRMARSGYPVRWTLAAFAKRYRPLAAGTDWLPVPLKTGGSKGSSKGGPKAAAAAKGATTAAATASPAAASLLTYRVSFGEGSLGFGVKFVRSGMPVVARISAGGALAGHLVAGHVLTHVGGSNLADAREATYADAKAAGKVRSASVRARAQGKTNSSSISGSSSSSSSGTTGVENRRAISRGAGCSH